MHIGHQEHIGLCSNFQINIKLSIQNFNFCLKQSNKALLMKNMHERLVRPYSNTKEAHWILENIYYKSGSSFCKACIMTYSPKNNHNWGMWEIDDLF